MSSKKYHLVKAIYDWCLEDGFTPYVAVNTYNNVTLPHSLTNNDALVLDISGDAAKNLLLTKQCLSFTTKFDDDVCDVFVPISKIVAVFAKETGDGLTLSKTDGDLEQDSSEDKSVKRSFKIVK